jgi:lauroyl/myristoyl acyltransferase
MGAVLRAARVHDDPPRRLQETSGAALVFCFAERLPRGEGFEMRFAPSRRLPADRAAAPRW